MAPPVLTLPKAALTGLGRLDDDGYFYLWARFSSPVNARLLYTYNMPQLHLRTKVRRGLAMAALPDYCFEEADSLSGIYLTAGQAWSFRSNDPQLTQSLWYTFQDIDNPPDDTVAAPIFRSHGLLPYSWKETAPGTWGSFGLRSQINAPLIKAQAFTPAVTGPYNVCTVAIRNLASINSPLSMALYDIGLSGLPTVPPLLNITVLPQPAGIALYHVLWPETLVLQAGHPYAISLAATDPTPFSTLWFGTSTNGPVFGDRFDSNDNGLTWGKQSDLARLYTLRVGLMLQPSWLAPYQQIFHL